MVFKIIIDIKIAMDTDFDSQKQRETRDFTLGIKGEE